MIPSQFQPIANHLWQSTLFACVAGLLTLPLRKNRARVRYGLWLAASLKFLVPFSILVTAGSHFGRQTQPPIAPPITMVIEQVSQPFSVPVPAATIPAAQRSSAGVIPLWTAWVVGFVFVLSSWWTRSRQIRAALRTASSVHLPIRIPAGIRVMSSPTIFEPGVFGIVRPILLLPGGITTHLTPAELEAILAHEVCHVRRRDNLATVIHMAVEGVFWFHPLVWWLGARLVEERERACDEEVLQAGSQPQVYAESILKICELYLKSPVPFVAGVTGSNLKKRIRAIMTNRGSESVNMPRKLVLMAAGVAALAAPIFMGVVNAPRIRAQSSAAAPKFEVATIKPCAPGSPLVNHLAGGTPGRLKLGCMSMKALIINSYVHYANGRFNQPGVRIVPIEKRPAWVDSDLYSIEAKAEGTPSQGMMRGPMMQALLEERFQLRIHTETREIPVYALTVAPGGPDLQVSKEASCRPLDSGQPLPAPALGQPLGPICGFAGITDDAFELRGVTMAELAASLSRRLDREVIDQTRIAGTFDIRVPLTPGLAGLLAPPPPLPGQAVNPAGSANPPDPTDFLDAAHAVARRLGLRLERTNGPGRFLVIDRVEKPSAN